VPPMQEPSRATAPAAARRGAARRAVAWIVLAAVPTTGCYTYTPLARTAGGGAQVAFDLNDRGRVGVEELLGPSVARVEGAVVRGSESEYVLAVREVRTLDGNSSKWAGEQVVLRREFVRDGYERRFSRGRTWAAVGGSVLAIGAFILSRSLGGTGAEDPDTKPKPPIEPARR
jgi:hypothetical protein